jgi:hypothetical protein
VKFIYLVVEPIGNNMTFSIFKSMKNAFDCLPYRVNERVENSCDLTVTTKMGLKDHIYMIEQAQSQPVSISSVGI